MLDVLDYKKHSIYYSCNCGAKGVCLIRPLGNEEAMVVELTCAHCGATRRIILVSDESKLNADVDYGIAIIMNNRIQERSA
jgi:hypothetical protein